MRGKVTRLRLGILLVVLSWLPFAQVVIWVGEDAGWLDGGSQADRVRIGIWTVQVVVGLIGVWLAGKVAVETAKRDGWRHTPRHLVRLFREGG